MSDAESDREVSRGPLRRIADKFLSHHPDPDRAADEELTEDADAAGFDLGTDLAHPSARHPVGFDLDTDIGRDNEPPELRR
jgi:hypothetical protein